MPLKMMNGLKIISFTSQISPWVKKIQTITKRWFDDERISWWWIKSNKSTNCTFVKVKNGDIAPFLELIKLHQKAVAKLIFKL